MKPPPPTTRLAVAPPRGIRRGSVRPAMRGPIILRPAAVAKDSTVLAAWLLILAGFLISCIPVLGFAIWIIGLPICLVVFILGIAAVAKGRVGHGVILMFSAFLAYALFWVAPFLSVAIAAALS